MTRLLSEIKDDFNFIKSHSVQPKWYKFGKIFILAAFLTLYCHLFGLLKTVFFCVLFFILSFLVHLLYRSKTNKFTRSWLDFGVENGKPRRIGLLYYPLTALNVVIAFIFSQLLIQ
jgi:cell division protein FtsW (lipid II flippase)